MAAKSRHFRPDFCFRRCTDISPAWLTSLGIRGVLIDIDNTITRWESKAVPPEDQAWLARLAEAGFGIRLLSNGLAQKKSAVVGQLGVPLVSGRLVKPLPAVFRRGLGDLGLMPTEVVMIGDSVFTDIVGANKVGLWTILVEPKSKVDFVGTKIYRCFEALLNLRRPLAPGRDFRRQAPPV